MVDHALGGSASVVPSPATVHEARLAFTGSGAEYFRLWVVHTLLTLLTLGVYSAWARVRKMRYFAQHTRLLGDAFDFDADPRRVLAGRVVALVLLVAYSHAFDWSLTAGFAVYAALLACGPWLFAGAQRFKLQNTRWRGLRFGFRPRVTAIYLTCVPLILIWTLSSVAAYAGLREGAALWIGGVTLLLVPWMYERLKALQHRHARFGALRFGFRSATPEVYGVWAVALLFGFVMIVIAVLGTAAFNYFFGDAAPGSPRGHTHGLAVMAVVGFALAVGAWPFFAAGMQKVVWEHTQCGPLRFRGEMVGGVFAVLVLKNVLLTALTAGLYWPFAAIALARYRVSSIVVVSDEPWPTVHAELVAPGTGALGDGAVDAFGLDVGW